MGERWLQGEDGSQGGHRNPWAQVRPSVLSTRHGWLTFTVAETTRN